MSSVCNKEMLMEIAQIAYMTFLFKENLDYLLFHSKTGELLHQPGVLAPLSH